MNFIILASVIILGFVIFFSIKFQQKNAENVDKEFWEREYQANFVRKKSLDDLDYISIPMHILPVSVLSEDETVKECLETLNMLSEKDIVNLTGYTNTDLKLMYGTANITDLSAFDENYTTLVTTLQKWADKLIEHGLFDEARDIMEYAVSINTDVSKTYTELLEYYILVDDDDKKAELFEKAEALTSPSQKMIVRLLNERVEKDY